MPATLSAFACASCSSISALSMFSSPLSSVDAEERKPCIVELQLRRLELLGRVSGMTAPSLRPGIHERRCDSVSPLQNQLPGRVAHGYGFNTLSQRRVCGSDLAGVLLESA